MYSIFEQLLQNHGWTPYEISKISGVSQATLSDWKNGKSMPRNKTLKKLADCLGVSVGYLKGEKTEKAPDAEAPRADERFKKMWAMYSSLSDEDKDAADKYLAFLSNNQKND